LAANSKQAKTIRVFIMRMSTALYKCLLKIDTFRIALVRDWGDMYQNRPWRNVVFFGRD
jgi:hypothetical protein